MFLAVPTARGGHDLADSRVVTLRKCLVSYQACDPVQFIGPMWPIIDSWRF
jgi:hypothetical protein